MSDPAIRELLSALRLFVRSANLELMSDAAYRATVARLSQELFDKYANDVEKALQLEEQRHDAETNEILYGNPN